VSLQSRYNVDGDTHEDDDAPILDNTSDSHNTVDDGRDTLYSLSLSRVDCGEKFDGVC